MGKFLKVVVVLIFIATGAALTLAIMNFNKREMLIGRAHTLEERIIMLARTFEDKEPVFDGIADHVAKDIDVVTDRLIDTPQTSDFWDTYEDKYEVTGTPTKNLTDEQHRLQLRRYYFLDNLGKPVKDPVSGAFKTDGKGTMMELLEEVQTLANNQFAWLNKTRQALTAVREELIATIRELNAEKQGHRASKKRITELNEKIAELENTIEEQKRQIAQLEREKQELNDKIVELETQYAELEEKYKDLDEQFRLLEARYLDIINNATKPPSAESNSNDVARRMLSPGLKGTIVHADADWSYVIVKFNDEAYTELTSSENQVIPNADFMVRRTGLKGPSGDVVSRIRLKSLKRDGSNLAIADNLLNWEQVPAQVGDEVFF